MPPKPITSQVCNTQSCANLTYWERYGQSCPYNADSSPDYPWPAAYRYCLYLPNDYACDGPSCQYKS